MTDEARTPLGVLLLAYRTKRGLSQQDLSARTLACAERDESVNTVAVRTIRSLEAESPAARNRRPRRATAHSLAVALDLKPGTPAYATFMTAAGYGTDREPSRQTAESQGFIEVGLEVALRRVAETIDTAAAGTPAALVIRGETGTGKSAIVDHACRRALDRHPQAVVLRATCVDPTDPHGPFIAMVQTMLGDPVAIASRRVSDENAIRLAARASLAARALASDGPLLAAISLSDPIIRRRIGDAVTDAGVADHLRRLGADGPNDALRVVQGCEQFFRVLSRYAAAGPVVLVFDDLDRADPATLASLSHLLGRVEHQPGLTVAILCTCLPDGQLDPATLALHEVLDDLHHRWPDGSVDLDAATQGTPARNFAAAMLESRGLPSGADAVDAVIARTDGLPQYMTALLDGIGSASVNGRVTAADLRLAELPADTVGALAARLRWLDPELRDIVVFASVLGTEFLAETAMQMLDIPVDRFIEIVDRRLWRRHRLVQEVGPLRVDGRIVHRYRFHPPLLRDAFYGSLSDLERSQAHARAADTLIDLFGHREPEMEERIAIHLDRAGRLVEAARAYLRAGEQARTVREFDTARRLLERIGTLGIRREDPETWLLSLISLGLVARGTDDLPSARAHLGRALDLATTHQLALVRAKALEALAMLDFHSGALEQGVERMLAATEIWAAHDAPDTSRALANLSYLLYGQGRYREAIVCAERARFEATRTGNERAWVDGTIALANCSIDLGRYAAAAELHEHARQAAIELGDTHRQVVCLINLSLIAIEHKDWDAATRELDRADRAVPPPSEALSAVIALQRGMIAEGRGAMSLAASHYRTARELHQRSEQPALELDGIAGELRVAVALGDLARSAELLAEIERRLADRGSIDGVEHPGRLYLTMIDASRALGDDARAQTHARAAVAFLTTRSTRVPDADRQGYLWEVPTHRRILDLAGELGVVTG